MGKMLSLETVESSFYADRRMDSRAMSTYSHHTDRRTSAYHASDFQLEHYRLLAPLGTGGFAQVYLGEDRVSREKVAIKMAHAGIGAARKAQFSAEAALHLRLHHSHIIRAHSFKEPEWIGTPFLVMDYAAVGTMRKQVPEGTQFPLPAVVNIVKQVASALHYLHHLGVVHRDVKPENLLVQSGMRVLLSDFGNARMIKQRTVEEHSDISGTASYMAPEQLQRRFSVASDQYALGITTYEWLSGVRPFSGIPLRVALQHLNSRPPAFREVGTYVPAEVEAVVMRALAKEPQQSFPDVWEFALALEQASKI
jgi:eukaryotic-like serine/threonine-protein kinase